jgi:xanthine dehydrogenase large subunit
LMLAISAREAIRDAISAYGAGFGIVELDSPATPERVYWAIQRARPAQTEIDELAAEAVAEPAAEADIAEPVAEAIRI